MTMFWIIWTFVCLGVTALDVHATVGYGTNPAWIVLAGGSTLFSLAMVCLTWPK